MNDQQGVATVRLVVRHRQNALAEIASLPVHHGAEIDVRTRRDELIVTHNPFGEGATLVEWLDLYRHAFLVVNVKEEGLEELIEPLLADRGVQDWMYLDQTFPSMVRTLQRGQQNCAVRVSEFESPSTAFALRPSPRWVWVDSFTGATAAASELVALREAGLQLMLVSPELQGRDPKPEVPVMRRWLADSGVECDAVCTKVPHLWT